MYEIVLPVDAEDETRAQAQVEAVLGLPADPGDLRVTVTHAFEDNPSGASIARLGPARHARDRLEAADIEVTLDERSGNPTESILAVADEVGADLIVVGGRTRTPTGKVLFGSVTQSVLLDADRPVMVN